MIDPKAQVTYAQYNEDLIIRALLHDVKKGFYVDVGANYPIIDSVTKIFYDQGWNGINIEPLKSLHAQILEERPKDVNLQIGIGDEPGAMFLREYTGMSGHSTFDDAQKKQHDSSVKHTDYPVNIKTLKDVLAEYKPKHIHFLKIDVEGYEYQVVSGNDWDVFRPEVICIEANHVSHDWRPILKSHKYRLFIADGLNEYYLAEEHWERTEGFAERIVELDYHALKQHQLQSWANDSKTLTELHRIIQDLQNNLDTSNNKLKSMNEMISLTLKNRSWPSRLKRSLYGLTVDWVRYRKSKKDKS